jgi:hypothetical protein
MPRAALYPFTILLFLAISGIARDASATQLSYTLYVFGLPVADAVLTVDLTPASYRASLAYHTTGLAGIFSGDRMEQHAAGRLDGDRPVPQEYASKGRLRGQDRLAGLTWRNGNPTVTAIAPPNETEREDVPAGLRPRTIDPLSSIVLLLLQTARSGSCDGSTRTFDGRRAQVFEARTGGEEDLPSSGRSSFSGRGLRCDFTDRTIAGFRLGQGRADDLRPHRGTIWLAQVVPGTLRLPVRASVETRFLGDAMIYLTAVSP